MMKVADSMMMPSSMPMASPSMTPRIRDFVSILVCSVRKKVEGCV